ncbi:MAG: hypothetical protein SPF91_08175 [Clostridium sp.]|nr:hypothetical protein [Clostridium sp.]
MEMQKTLTASSIAEVLSARQKLAEACSAYMEANGNRRVYTGTGQKRLEVIKNLDTFFPKYFDNLYQYYHKLYPEKHLERLREPLIFNANAGKSLNQLNIEPAAHIQEASFENQVGGNASERYQVSYQDKRGFFTPKEYVKDIPTVVEEMVKAEKNPEHQKVLEANKRFLKANAESVQTNGVDTVLRYELDLMKYWDSLPETTNEEVEKKKIFAGLIANVDVKKPQNEAEKKPQSETEKKPQSAKVSKKFIHLKNLINSYRSELEMLSDEERKDPVKRENTYHACLNAYYDTEDYVPLSKCSKMIANYAETREAIKEGLRGTEANKAMFEHLLYGAMTHNFSSDLSESYQIRKQLIANPDIFEKAITIMKKANMAALPMGPELGELKAGDELSGRNVASSRIAELLGVGNLLAHSEKMTVQIGGQKVEGSFMEFAEGVDIRNSKDEALEQINQIRIENSPGFTRDACNLEVLDYLCAQADRHGGNMFLKLSEPQEDGKREILGLQGIDNDLAFSTKKDIVLQQGNLDELCFISENLAQNILATDRNKLQFVLGDILSEAEIDALDDRMTKMQDHIRNNMIQVKDDEWALDRDPSRKLEQALTADPDKLSRYQQGVNSLNEDLDLRRGLHKISHVGNEIEKAQARYNSLQPEHAAEAAQAQAPEAAAREQAQPEREQVQPERTETPAAGRQVVRESLNMWLKEEARSKRAPKEEVPQKSREIELGAHRRGPRK